MYNMYYSITYLPHKAVAEVSKDKEPIGRECAEFNWFENQLMSDSNELRVKWFGCHLIWDSNDFGCQLIWDSNDLVVNRCVLQMIVVVCWFELQVMCLSIDLRDQVIWLSIDLRFKWVGCQLRFKWFGCQMIWGSSDLVVNWCVIQMILSTEAFVRDFLQNWSFETQKRRISTWILRQCSNWFGNGNMYLKSRRWRKRWSSKIKRWSSKTQKYVLEIKAVAETLTLKNETLKLKNKRRSSKTNEAFLRDFLQKRSFEDQKRSFSAKLPSKTKLGRSKTKLFCETSFKIEALKLKNEAILRDFLQKWSFEAQKRSFSARLPLKPKLWLKNEAFLRDLLQKRSFEDQKWSISARLPSKMKLWR